MKAKNALGVRNKDVRKNKGLIKSLKQIIQIYVMIALKSHRRMIRSIGNYILANGALNVVFLSISPTETLTKTAGIANGRIKSFKLLKTSKF